MQIGDSFNHFEGTLRAHPENPRYFTDGSGRAVYLTGMHTWENLQDFITAGRTGIDYGHYLDVMHEKKQNFMRMWIWEHGAWMPGTEEMVVVDPLPYQRTGPGLALDGKPRYDLDRWNEAFFERLGNRVTEAGQLGIYVSVMLFEGWSIRKPWVPGDPWRGHPYHRENNVNGVDGDHDNDGIADIHSLDIPAVVLRQEGFVRKVVDTVNGLDNVLYEIINEGNGSDKFLDWEIHMVDFVHQYESGKPKQHPVGMTPSGNEKEKTLLFSCPADWISPTYIMDPKYKTDPPAADGSKVILNDTDHVDDQLSVYHNWVWKCMLRGQNPVFMDPWDSIDFCGQSMVTPSSIRRLELIRDNMGYSRVLSERINLVKMVPAGELASTGYCLADPGSEYLVYLPEGGVASLDLCGAAHAYAAEWFDPVSGATTPAEQVVGGEVRWFTAPFANDAVLYVRKSDNLG